jgi:hypothetical protein
VRPGPLSRPRPARRHELTRAKAIQALRELDRAGAPVTFAGVASAGVSRLWLYTQPDISDQIRRLRKSTGGVGGSGATPACQRATDASLRARLTATLDRNKQVADENARLRRQFPHALGAAREASFHDLVHRLLRRSRVSARPVKRDLRRRCMNSYLW